MKEHEAIHNPTTSFCGWTDSEAALDTLNASVTTASLNATLSNQGFCDGDKNEQRFSQEDVEYGIFLEPYNNKKRVQNE